MKKKTVFYTEIAYLAGLILLALGAALTERASFGMSMVIAPPYILYLKISQYLPFFTFGMAAYTFQGLLLLITILVIRKAKISYLFSFGTAVLYGVILDTINLFAVHIPADLFVVRILLFSFGILASTLGVALMFKTYLPPEAYELIVKEISNKYNLKIHKVKYVYDFSSLILSVIISFAFFGFGVFNGIHVGTLISAIVNGSIINFHNKKLEQNFEFKDLFKKK